MYHYTYLLLHKTTSKRYIGVRTSKVPPIQDTEYWGSSIHIPSDVKSTHIKIILKEFVTRDEAVRHEILLHELNNVAVSENFYNRAKQTSIKFDTAGTTLTAEHKEKCRIASTGKRHTKETREKLSALLKGRKFTEETKKRMSQSQKYLYNKKGYVNPRQGITMTEELKSKISEAVIAKKCNKGTNNNTFKPWFITYQGVTMEYYNTTKREQSILDGFKPNYYTDLSTKSKGVKPIGKGNFKGAIIGNLPTVEDIV